MDLALFTAAGFEFLSRWMHFLAGITWIGLLYYFNFVQGSWFKETDTNTKNAAVQKLVPRALWWFRWGAMFTFLSGAMILIGRGHASEWMAYSGSWGVLILTGAALGTLMFLNVWLVIWPNQKIIIAAANGQNIGNAADAAAKAGLASRTNTMFSIPMLFFMGSASYLPLQVNPENGFTCVALAIAVVLAALEFNGLKGKMGPMTSVSGVIGCGFALTAVLYSVIEICL